MHRKRTSLSVLVYLFRTIRLVPALLSRYSIHTSPKRVLFRVFGSTSNVTPATSSIIPSQVVTNKLKEGLLISSFSEGLVPNNAARDVLIRGLWRCLLTEEQQEAEKALANSVRFSPCNGPNTDLLLRLEQIDQVIRIFQENRNTDWHDTLQHRAKLRCETSDLDDTTTILRFVYIPTAMYALRPGSQNTPGKQRQRARTDAKLRRDKLVDFLLDAMNVDDLNRVAIAVVTLDLDDGSIKHPVVSTLLNHGVYADFPTEGTEALQEWIPHFVFVQGGNTFWLHHCLEKGNWRDTLVHLLHGDTTFYCGASAGAILAGASMETACWKGWDDPSVVPDRDKYDAWKGVDGLDLLQESVAIFPHFEEQWSLLLEGKREELKARIGIDTIPLRDQDVCFVCDGVCTIL